MGSLRLRRIRRRLVLGSTKTLAVALLVSAVATLPHQQSATASAPHPAAAILPAKVDAYVLQQEPLAAQSFIPYRRHSLISQLALYEVKKDGVAIGTLQVAKFKRNVAYGSANLQRSVLQSLGGNDSVAITDGERLYVTFQNQLSLLVHFDVNGPTYEILAAENSLTDPGQFFSHVLLREGGSNLDHLAQMSPPAEDARRNLQ